MNSQNQKLTTYTALGLIALIVSIIVFVQIDRARGTQVETKTLDYTNQPMLGRADAPVKIAIFEDFRCGGCAVFTENTEPMLVRDYVDTGKAALYFFNMPILGPGSNEAAQMAECVYQEDAERFWDYKTYAYRTHLSEGPGAMNAARLSELAALAVTDLDPVSVQTCAQEAWYDDAVQIDLDMGNTLSINATPAIIINGTLVSSLTYDAMKTLIDKELAETTTASR